MKLLKRLFARKKSLSEIDTIARDTVLLYFQSWGQGLSGRVKALNEIVAFCGIKAEFAQDDARNEWHASRLMEAIRAREFRAKLDSCFPRGQFEAEQSAVISLILEYVEVK